MHQYSLQQKTFLALLVLVTIGFFWVLAPYAGAVFWGIVLAILFAPVYRWLLRKTNQKPNLSSLITLFLIVVIVILPLSLVAVSLVNQAAGVVEMVKTGELSMGMFFKKIMAVLPRWAIGLLERFDLTSLATIEEKITAAASQMSQVVAKQAIYVGSYTFDFLVSMFIMLYLLFFLLRDGYSLAGRIKSAVPLTRKYKQRLFTNFTTVIRATVKGNVLVAIAQGALGGLAFWFLGVQGAVLWATLMAFLSLLPAIGAAIVWAPVAVYFLATGAIWQGVALTAWGVVVIGLVDNLLRPLLVGKDTKMPDYVVLLSTVGGMALFGLNGFVIGPVVAALFLACWDLFVNAEEFHEE
ncbi:MAG: family transporter [Massilia sp.]|nr:family transporter [Massilia sp.]